MLKIVFQGDSVTACGRTVDKDGLGSGYVRMCVETLRAFYPDKEAAFYNRAIGGNRLCDVAARWQEDCTALCPDVLTLMIGVNDVWRLYDSGLESPDEQFEACLTELLAPLKKNGTKIILLEPFIVPDPDFTDMRKELNGKIDAVRRVAKSYADALISTDALFAQAARKYSPQALTLEGVHPKPVGHRIIAAALLKELAVYFE